MGVQSLQTLRKTRMGYAAAGRLYSEFWSNLSKNFSFGVLYSYCCIGGVTFAGATCRPWAKNLKIGL